MASSMLMIAMQKNASLSGSFVMGLGIHRLLASFVLRMQCVVQQLTYSGNGSQESAAPEKAN